MSIHVMNEVWGKSSHDKGGLLVMLAIADFADEQGRAFPSIATLALKTRQTERNVHNVLSKLVESKELTIYPNKGPFGTNLYQINLSQLGKKKPKGGGEIISGGGENSSKKGVKKFPEGGEIISENDEKISPDPSCDPPLEPSYDPSMQACQKIEQTNDHDACLLASENSKKLLRSCGVKNTKVIDELSIVPTQKIENLWAFVNNITCDDKPSLLVYYLRDAIANGEINPSLTQSAPPEALQFTKPEWITDQEWFETLAATPEVYALLDNAELGQFGGIHCQNDENNRHFGDEGQFYVLGESLEAVAKVRAKYRKMGFNV